MLPINQLLVGDAQTTLSLIPDASIDALILDPPSGTKFMGAAWDSDKGGRTQWVAWLTAIMCEAYRTMKPGAHGLVWALPRTSHWTAWALEEAGFEIRDCLTHLFLSGMPKGLNIAKGIDKRLGKKREVVGQEPYASRKPHSYEGGNALQISLKDTRVGQPITLPASDESARWEGWNTALKPASEHWWLIRKPLDEKTIVKQVLSTGTGGLNIDATRVAGTWTRSTPWGDDIRGGKYNAQEKKKYPREPQENHESGRYSPNVLLSHTLLCDDEICDSSCPVSLLDTQIDRAISHYLPTFHYAPKASTRERNAGCSTLDTQVTTVGDSRPSGDFTQRMHPKLEYEPKPRANTHPTLKNQSLMRWLCRLITPPEGVILDCFAGSGSTLVAAIAEGFSFVGIEKDEAFAKIAQARVEYALAQKEQETA